MMLAIVKAYVERHLQHLLYLKTQLVAAYNDSLEMGELDRERWIANHLPERPYEHRCDNYS
jgi:hypothetical protein